MKPDDTGHSPHGRSCPRCDGPVYRVSRRFVDRVINFFVPVRRYRCISEICGWEGNQRERAGFPSLNARYELPERQYKIIEPSRMNRITPFPAPSNPPK